MHDIRGNDSETPGPTILKAGIAEGLGEGGDTMTQTRFPAPRFLLCGGLRFGVLAAALLGCLAGCQALAWTDWSFAVRSSPRVEKPLPPELSALGVPEGGAPPKELSIDLSQAVALALANNPAVRMALEEIEKGKGTLMTAWSSILPSANLGLSYYRPDEVGKFTVSLGGPPMEMELGVIDNYKAELGVRLPLFLGGMGLGGIRLASLGADYVYLAIDHTAQQIAFLAKKSYADLLFARESLAVFEKGLANAQAHLRDVKERLAQKVGTQFDVLRGEVKVANARAALIQGKNARQMARAAFLRALGLPQDTQFQLRDSLAHAPVKISLSESLTRALGQRLDLRQAALAVDIADKRIDLQVGALLPKAFAFFNYGWEKPSSKSFGGSDGDTYWNAGMSIDVPLFDGFSGLGKIRKGYAELRQARWAHENLRQQIAVEVRQAVSGLRNATEFVDSQSENVRQAEETLRLVKIGFDVGSNTQLDVLDVQTALTAARLNHLQAVYGFMTARFALERAEASLRVDVRSKK
jgi:outer membrane protein TolC